MKKDYVNDSKKLAKALGGKDNIKRVFHCMTRLRFYVKDKNRINENEIKSLPEVSGINWHKDQLQVIVGNDVKDMYKKLHYTYAEITLNYGNRIHYNLV